MSVDIFPILPADDIAMSIRHPNSLADRQVRYAQTALRCIGRAWSLDCCESFEGDWFLDLSSTRPDGRVVSFIIHACDGTVQVLKMVQDDHRRLGSFDDIAQAVAALLTAIEATLD